MRQRRCQYVKPSGARCGANALPGKRCCLFHDKASAAKTAEGRRKGGENRKVPASTLPPDTPPLKLESVADVTRALGEAYNLVRVGKIGVNVGNALGQLGQVLLKAMEKGDLEQRIEALEASRARRGR